jgi:hypothetical protein
MLASNRVGAVAILDPRQLGHDQAQRFMPAGNSKAAALTDQGRRQAVPRAGELMGEATL